MVEVFHGVEGANCKDCVEKETCGYLAEGEWESTISLKTGCLIKCCSFVKVLTDD